MREPGLVPKKEVARGFLREEEEEEDWSGAEGNCVNIWSFVAIFVGVKSLLEIDRVEDIACDFEDTHSIQFNSILNLAKVIPLVRSSSMFANSFFNGLAKGREYFSIYCLTPIVYLYTLSAIFCFSLSKLSFVLINDTLVLLQL